MSTETIVAKIHKSLEQLKARNDKLIDENSKLKAVVAEAKTKHSRVRRIPAKTVPGSAADEVRA